MMEEIFKELLYALEDAAACNADDKVERLKELLLRMYVEKQ